MLPPKGESTSHDLTELEDEHADGMSESEVRGRARWVRDGGVDAATERTGRVDGAPTPGKDDELRA